MILKPTCPNHKVELTQTGFPLPSKGQGTCPVSGATFAFEAETVSDAVKLDVNGKAIVEKQWRVTGED